MTEPDNSKPNVLPGDGSSSPAAPELAAAELPLPDGKPDNRIDGKPANQSDGKAHNQIDNQTDGQSDGQSDGLNEGLQEQVAPVSQPGEFFVVGIGASAGGLEAITSLLRSVTLDSLAVIVVQHLDPMHESVLPSLLSRTTTSEVVLAAEGMKVLPRHIYVIPPNSDLALHKGVIHLLAPPVGHGVRLPIDYFFRSLAADQESRAVGVVLSGTGTDGTFGLRAIKESGGVTFAQDPATAKYDGMPRNAIESGWADFTMSPEAIADELQQISHNPLVVRRPLPTPDVHEHLGKLIALIRATFGNDLAEYKPSTLERRIERRMALQNLEKLADYVRFVKSNPEELKLLYQDVLIGVTSFFRDHDSFEAFKSKTLPRILEQKQPGASLRIWVPACSTGEEAYSFAICVLEYLEDRAQDFRIQIFGTDVDESSIQHARRGAYPENIALDVSPERLQRFFIKKGNEYQVIRRLRDMIVFSVQNVIKDAPFSRLDMVSCRNLLIYLRPPTQKKVLRILHYSLNSNGFLALGTSETVGDSSTLFVMVDRKNKIYSKKRSAALSSTDIGFEVSAPQSAGMVAALPKTRTHVNLSGLADRKILDMYGPPGVLINEQLEVLHFRGRTGLYLEPLPGAASFNLLRLARPELHVDLRRAIHQAQSQDMRVSLDSVRHDNGVTVNFRLEVVPIHDPETRARCLLVLFHETPAEAVALKEAIPAAGPGQTSGPEDSERVAELERDLLVTKEYLQSTVEELESANEELKSSNEELQSSNEELQSTNEELETSKEELQSTNEELTTVNDELQNRMKELQVTNDDLHNVLLGIDNAVVIVDLEGRIRRFTSAAERLLNLVQTDVGRSVNMLNSFVVNRRIEQIVANVIEKLNRVDEEVVCADDRWYSLRISPYKTLDHAIRGAVIVIVDVDVKKRATDVMRNVREYAGSFLSLIVHPLAIVDKKTRVVWANDPFYDEFHLVPEETIGGLLGTIGGGQWTDAGLSRRLEQGFASGTSFRDLFVRRTFADKNAKTWKISGSRLPPMGGDSSLMLLAFEDCLPEK